MLKEPVAVAVAVAVSVAAEKRKHHATMTTLSRCELLGGVRCLSLLLGLLAGSAVPCAASDLPESWIKDDPRLTQTITLPPGIRWLGGLIGEISRTSGIRVQLDAATLRARGGEELISAVPRATVHELLSGIWSLYSQRSCEWHWTRKGRGESTIYELSQGFKGARSEAMLRAAVDQLWLRHAARMMQAATGTDAERLRLARDDDAVRLLVHESSEEGRNEIFMAVAGVQVMLDKETLLRLLSGRQEIIAPVNSLNAGLAESLRITRLRTDRLRRQSVQKGFPYRPEPEPDVVTLSVKRSTGAVLPGLWYHQAVLDAETHRPAGKWGGVVMGGTRATNQALDELAALWRLPGDETASPKGGIGARQRADNPAAKPAAGSAPTPDAPSSSRLSPQDARGRARAMGVCEAAMRFNTPVLARVPWSSDRGRELQQAGQVETLDAYLAPLSAPGSYVRCKWRGPVLLIGQLTWFQPEFTAEVAPWPVVQDLARLDGHPGTDGVEAALSDVAPRLTGRQWVALGRCFPPLKAGSEYGSDFPALLMHAIFRARRASIHVRTGLQQLEGVAAAEFISTIPAADLDNAFRGLRTWPEKSRVRIESDSDRGDLIWRLKATYGDPEEQLLAELRWPATSPRRDPFLHGLLPPGLSD